MSTLAVDAMHGKVITGASSRYRCYVLTVLVLVGVCSWTDRQVFSIALESIKHELGFSDTQLGLLGGTAFGLFYVSVGLPVAWLADRWNRRSIVAGAVALWSVMTALTGAASSFASMFLCRMGVGIGEAGGAAPSQSMISDYFPAHRRALAMGVLYLNIPLGYLISYWLGGNLNDTLGWRSAFVIFGIAGIVVAVLARTTVREPERTSWAGASVSASANATGFVSTIRFFLSRRALRHVPLAGAAHGIGMFGAAVWMPAYFSRTFHMTSAQVGIRLALIMGIAGVVGVVAGGYLVDRLVRRYGDVRWYTRFCSLVLFASIPFTVGVYLCHSSSMALALFILPTLLSHMFLGPVVATMQGLAGARRRAMGAAFYLFLVNLISSSLGPLIIGILSDRFRASFGADSLRYSLLLLVPTTCAWAATHMALASRTMRADFAAANEV